MRLLVVIDTWGLVGGTERYAGQVVPALAERGHQVSVLCAEARWPAPRGVRLLVEPALAKRPLSDAERDGLARSATDGDPDAIYLLTARNAHAFEVLLNVAPVVRYVQDHTLFCPGLNKMREDGEVCTVPFGLPCLQRYFLSSGCTGFKPAVHKNRLLDPLRMVGKKHREIEMHRRAAVIFTSSRYMQGELAQAGLEPDRVELLPYFTRAASSAEPREQASGELERFLINGGTNKAPLVFTPARLVLPDKGVDYLLTALGKLRRPFRAVISGSGPAEDWLKRKADDEGLADRVHFAGWSSPGLVEALYSLARVVVCPSVWNEPFGLVGLEAMAHGRPVVAFAVGGIPEWLTDGVNGFLVARKDTDAMAGAIDQLLENAELTQRMGAAGKQRVGREFSEQRHLEILESGLRRAAR